MRYFLKLFLCLFIALPMYVQAGTLGSTDNVQLIQTDFAANQLSAYYDLRQRRSFIQISNITNSDVTIHVQIFQHDRGCTELNFDDTLTGNDTVVYDLENLIKNNGSQAPINLQDDSYGYIVVTDRIVDSETSPTPTLIGNFRIVDDAGYEYRTNMPAVSPGNPLASDLDEIDFQAHFNTVDGANQADLIGYLYTDAGSSTVRNFTPGINFDVFVYDFFEEPLSCDRRNFACGNVMNYGINEDYGSSRDNPPVCPGGGLADFDGGEGARALSNGLNGGFVDLVNGALGAPTSQLPVFVYLIGINNGNGTGSMDTWIDPTVPAEICDDGIDNDDDGLVDCEDNNCGINGTGNGADICYEATCDDMLDNEVEMSMQFGDGADCADEDCFGIDITIITTDTDGTIISSITTMCERSEITCDDGFDNDGDEDIDCADEDCSEDEACDMACGDDNMCSVFKSITDVRGDFGGALQADSICQGEADTAGLTAGNGYGPFMAWVSDGSTSPSARFTQNTVPYILHSGGATIANNYSDLTTMDILNVINLDTNGADIGRRIWTGTAQDGTSTGFDCMDWTTIDSNETGTYGDDEDTNADWTNESGTNGRAECDNRRQFYCFEQ